MSCLRRRRSECIGTEIKNCLTANFLELTVRSFYPSASAQRRNKNRLTLSFLARNACTAFRKRRRMWIRLPYEGVGTGLHFHHLSKKVNAESWTVTPALAAAESFQPFPPLQNRQRAVHHGVRSPLVDDECVAYGNLYTFGEGPRCAQISRSTKN